MCPVAELSAIKGVKSGSRTQAGQDPASSAAESAACRQFGNLTQAGMVFKKRHPQKNEISALPEIRRRSVFYAYQERLRA